MTMPDPMNIQQVYASSDMSIIRDGRVVYWSRIELSGHESCDFKLEATGGYVVKGRIVADEQISIDVPDDQPFAIWSNGEADGTQESWYHVDDPNWFRSAFEALEYE